jgi:hypothetical protein
VQEHFEPGDAFAPSGPLFGVQISNLPCSDINVRFSETGIIGAGTHRAPLGLAADPGGISLFKAGVPVGSVGVAADGIYGLDANAQDRERNIDEQIALAGAFGFLAPADRRADQITAGGLLLQYTTVAVNELARDPSTAPAFATLGPNVGAIIAVPGYANAVISRGMAFGQPESGIRADTTEYPGLDAFRRGQRREREPLPAPRRYRRPGRAEEGRGPRHRAGGAQDHLPHARPGASPARLAGGRDHRDHRHQRRGAGHRPLPRLPGRRHRRNHAEGAHRGLLLGVLRRSRLGQCRARHVLQHGPQPFRGHRGADHQGHDIGRAR